MSAVNEIRNDIASTQATIDQARAYLRNHTHVLDEAMTSLIERQLDERQAKLDSARTTVNNLLP